MKHFLPKNESVTEEKPAEEEPMDQQASVTEEASSQPTSNRKKRSILPLNLDDYEKRRSARSVSTSESVSEQSKGIFDRLDYSSDIR